MSAKRMGTVTLLVRPVPARKPCAGKIEQSGLWWTCSKCGHCGGGSVFLHYPITNPVAFLLHSLGYYVVRRAAQSAPIRGSGREAVYAMGAMLRQVADTAHVEEEDMRNHYVP